MAHVLIDFNVNDSYKAVRSLIERLAPINEAVIAGKHSIDLRRAQYLGPAAVAILAATIIECRARSQECRIDFPNGPEELRAFCHVSRLHHIANSADAPPPETSHPEVIPAMAFHVAGVTAHLPLLRLIERHVEVSDEFRLQLGTCVSEVMQNVQDHSMSSFGGIFSARYLINKKQVRVAIVDRGRGIRQTLLKNYPDTTTSTIALQRVLRGEYSAKSRLNNLGLGLSTLAGMVANAKGEAFIISEDGMAIIKYGESRRFQTIRCKFSGTAVFFSLPTT